MPTNSTPSLAQKHEYEQQLAFLNEQRLEIARQMNAAIESGQAEKVKDLLRYTLNKPTSYDLYRAAMHGHSAVVEFFLQQEVNSNEDADYYTQKPIHIAILNNDLTVVELLVRYGADFLTPYLFFPHFPQEDYSQRVNERIKVSALDFAKQLKREEIVSFLNNKMENDKIKQLMAIEHIVIPSTSNPNETYQAFSSPCP